jgi:hypothetical protein
MSSERSVKDLSGPYNDLVGAGDGNRTHVRSLGSFYTAIVRRPLDIDFTTVRLQSKPNSVSQYFPKH